MSGKGRPKGRHDIAPMMRHAFTRGIGIVARRRGLTVPELMAEWIEEDWKAVLTAMSKFTVKEKVIDGKVAVDVTLPYTAQQLSDTDRLVLEAVAVREERALPKPH